MPKVTKNYVRLHGPTTEQLAAIELLVTGKTDRETAEAVGVARETVTCWRLYDAHFQAELNKRRQAVFGAAVDRLRALLPLALEVLEGELRNPNTSYRGQLALSVLKTAGLFVGDIGPTDPEAVIDKAALDRSGNQEAIRYGVTLPHDREALLRVWAEALADEES